MRANAYGYALPRGSKYFVLFKDEFTGYQTFYDTSLRFLIYGNVLFRWLNEKPDST